MVKIAPSILAANYAKLGEEIEIVEKAGADFIHIDVMDGKFVPNCTDGEFMIKVAKEHTKLPLDVHLMVENPIEYSKNFFDATNITFHIEAVTEGQAKELIKSLKEKGIKVGISIKPNTSIETLKPYLDKIDMVLVMTVEPGFGGQKLIPETIEKIKLLRKENPFLDIEVDGGINLETANTVIKAGANILVAGTAIFKAEDKASIIQKMKTS